MKFDIDLPIPVQMIIKHLEKFKYEAYIVGGCVRDSILNRVPNDWDICTSATPKQILHAFEDEYVIPTGLKHGTVTIMLDQTPYEITTFRSDGKYEDNRHPNSVNFVTDITEDLKRRDFTINAMAYNSKTGLLDPFGGRNDIRNKEINCVGAPKERFDEDGLRILRALRFRCQLENFHIHRETLGAMHECVDYLDNLSKERIREEFLKAFENTYNFVDCMGTFNFLWNKVFPELESMCFPQNNPYHIYNVYTHTMIALLTISQLSMDTITKLAVFFHDIGKPHSYQDGEDNTRHFKGHGKVGSDMTDIIMRRLKFDNDTRTKVVELVYYHDAMFEIGEKYIKRWLNKIGEMQFRRLIALRKADIEAQNPLYKNDRLLKLDRTKETLETVLLNKSCFQLKDLSIDGNDLISIGYKQGCEIGKALKELLELVIEGKIENDKEKLMFFLKNK